jgi:hypothetical protein
MAPRPIPRPFEAAPKRSYVIGMNISNRKFTSGMICRQTHKFIFMLFVKNIIAGKIIAYWTCSTIRLVIEQLYYRRFILANFVKNI